MAKKLLAILAALCIVAAMGSVGASAVLRPVLVDNAATGEWQLFANETGTGEFHILVVPDAHQTADADPNLVGYITAAVKYMAVEQSSLDLVIFLGDAISGTGATAANAAGAIQRLVDPLVAAKIPYTVVFGDADVAGGMTGADLLPLWKAAGAYTAEYEVDKFEDQVDPANPSGPKIPVKVGTETKTMASSLYVEPTLSMSGGGASLYLVQRDVFEDAKGNETYKKITPHGTLPDTVNTYLRSDPFAQLILFDGVQSAAQVSWFTDTAIKAYPGLAAYVFQHYPLPEVYAGGYFCRTWFNWALPCAVNVNGIHYFTLPNFAKMVGTVMENPTLTADAGAYEAFKAASNVQAAFFGHNHLNRFTETHGSLRLEQLSGAAWNGGSGCYVVRGGTFVSIRSNGASTYYQPDLFSYRQASRVPGSTVPDAARDASDTWKGTTYFFQNLLITMLSPFRWIFN